MGGSEEAVVWTAPRKKINSQANLQLFLESDACKKLVGFIQVRLVHIHSDHLRNEQGS